VCPIRSLPRPLRQATSPTGSFPWFFDFELERPRDTTQFVFCPFPPFHPAMVLPLIDQLLHPLFTMLRVRTYLLVFGAIPCLVDRIPTPLSFFATLFKDFPLSGRLTSSPPTNSIPSAFLASIFLLIEPSDSLTPAHYFFFPRSV